MCKEERKKNRKKLKKKSNRNRNDSDLTDDNDENQVEPRNMTPKRTGNISLTKNRKVSYEIKNGQPVFRLRRSPRKSLKNAYLEATHEKAPIQHDMAASEIPLDSKTVVASHTPIKRRRSSKLFTPSGDKDYLVISPKRKAMKMSKPNIPSPVKFVADDTNVNEDKENPAVLHIIDRLEDNLETEHPTIETSQVSIIVCLEIGFFTVQRKARTLDHVNQTGTYLYLFQDNYAMYVTEDEAARLARETMQELELADLEQSFEFMEDSEYMLAGTEDLEKNMSRSAEVEIDHKLKLVENYPMESNGEIYDSKKNRTPEKNINIQNEEEKENKFIPVETGIPEKNGNKASKKKLFSIFDQPSTLMQTETRRQSVRNRAPKTITTQVNIIIPSDWGQDSPHPILGVTEPGIYYFTT